MTAKDTINLFSKLPLVAITGLFARFRKFRNFIQGGGLFPKYSEHVYPEDLAFFILGSIFLNTYQEGEKRLKLLRDVLNYEGSILYELTRILSDHTIAESVEAIEIDSDWLQSKVIYKDGTVKAFDGVIVGDPLFIQRRDYIERIAEPLVKISSEAITRFSIALSIPDGESVSKWGSSEEDELKRAEIDTAKFDDYYNMYFDGTRHKQRNEIAV